MADVERQPGRRGARSVAAPSIMIVSIVVGAVISLLLWYFVARQAAVVAKWIVVVFFAIGLLVVLSRAAVRTT